MHEELLKTHVSVLRAARELGVTRAKAYDLLSTGQVDGICDAQSGWLVSLTSIERFKSRAQVPTTA